MMITIVTMERLAASLRESSPAVLRLAQSAVREEITAVQEISLYVI
jgi:hypothetical protein